jgi:hypothetical protein
LRQAIPPPEEAGLTDGHLLECFQAQQDEAAFAVLVKRHGAMVLGVCRRMLSDPHDAFQATFLVGHSEARASPHSQHGIHDPAAPCMPSLLAAVLKHFLILTAGMP